MTAGREERRFVVRWDGGDDAGLDTWSRSCKAAHGPGASKARSG